MLVPPNAVHAACAYGPIVLLVEPMVTVVDGPGEPGNLEATVGGVTFELTRLP